MCGIVGYVGTGSSQEKTLGNVEECKARGAPVIGIVTEGDTSTPKYIDDTIVVPQSSNQLTPLTSVIAMQLFAYHMAKWRGCEIDQPRNLAKSVTVE